MIQMVEDLYLGIDVGTGSARAGIFDVRGVLIGQCTQSIKMLQPQDGYAEQSSANIWRSICDATRQAIKSSGVEADQIKGIGFDATCSLVAIDKEAAPVSLSQSGDDQWNVIVWMDHRAESEAKLIDQTNADVLNAVGGTISLEMQMPKLKWLKKHLPDQWARTDRFFDLPDWLVYKSTGMDTRSLCSAVCKWTYEGHKGLEGEGWDTDFLQQIDLAELDAHNFKKIGQTFKSPGEPIGTLSTDAAQELGLSPDTIVAASMIDAYAGALGTLGVDLDHSSISNRLALIAGTSACHIALTNEARFVPGVWGPYFGVLLPDFWALEAGQSAAGALLDAVVNRHGASQELQTRSELQRCSIYQLLNDCLIEAASGKEVATLTQVRHVQPDFHGNRSPLADPSRKGAITGLSLSTGLEDLVLDYLATLQALAYSTRQIIDALGEKDVTIDTLIVSGGLAQNPIYLQTHADVTGCEIIVPDQQEPVLLGSAVLASIACGRFADLQAGMKAMSGQGRKILPNRDPSIVEFHNRKYRVFEKMQRDFVSYQDMMCEE